MKSLRERILLRSESTEDGCLLWTGSKSSKGYGRLYTNTGYRSVHRVMYEVVFGPIPEGLEIDHTCHNVSTSCGGGPTCKHRRCVNPAHLEAVTTKVNCERRPRQNQNDGKTHCVNGHEFDDENTYNRSDGRACKECNRRAALAYYHRSKSV